MTSIRRASASWLPAGLLEWHCQCSIVVGNWLYIDGGEIWASSLNEGGMEYMSFTLSISLNSSWTTSNVVATANPYPDSIARDMVTRKPTLWLDSVKKSVYRWGGCPYYNATVAVFAFPVNDQGSVTWTKEYTGGVLNHSSMATFSGFTDPAYALSASSPTAYYSLGGFMSGTTDPGLAGLAPYAFPFEGLVEYNFSEVQWSNSSSTPYGGAIFGGSTGFAVLGQGLFVPIFGQQGILVFIGGDAPTTQKAYTEGDSLVPINQITIYDIHSQTFYLQSAGGAVPNPRTSFCAVGAGSAENSTWEIFIYGGDHPGTGTAAYSLDNNATVLGLDKVYILTLPAFQWVEAPGTSGTTRSYHHCQVIGQRQMLSIGGQAIDSNLSAQDPWTNGLAIFDMSELTWTFNYDANAAAYAPPTLVSNYYNTSNRYPSFNDAALAAIFNVTATSTIAPSTNATGTPATTPPPPASNSSHTGAIAGGVVGGVAAIALLAGLCYFFWKRHKQQKHNGANFEMGSDIVPEMDEQRRPLEIYSKVHDSRTLPMLGDTAVLAELG